MDKQTLINEIAKRNHIILDEQDPIFAIISANELLFEDYLRQIDKLLIKHKADLESYKATILQELKEYSNENTTTLKTLLRDNQQENKAQPTPTEPKEKQKFTTNTLLFTVSSQIIFLLVGLIIGLLI